MIVDTSAIVAIILDEPEREVFLKEITGASSVTMSAASVVELVACYAAKRRLEDPLAVMRADLVTLGVDVAPVTPDQALIAAAARLRYGRGTGHQARLNYGDSFSYALARVVDLPLLFKGNDFIHTDVRRVI